MKFSGTVTEGEREGRALGFPTINIPMPNADVNGIYAARVEARGASYDGVAYANVRRKILETHLFDFSGDLYGAEIAVELFKKLRDDSAFPDEASLKKAIARDVENAREYFRTL